MIKLIASGVVLLFCIATSGALFAQEAGQAEIEALRKRVTELEQQLKTVVQEMALIKAARTDTKHENSSSSASAETKPIANTVPPEQPLAKKKDLGVDVGSARLTPYGIIFFNAFGNTAGTNNADVPLWATQTGNSNFGSTVRQTRLGLRLEGAKIGNANVGGVVEVDFYGGSPAVAIGENFGVVRLRLANARIAWEKTALTVGQDWMVFAPQNPTSLVAAAIPQMAAAGNNWARLPQVKVQQKLGSGFTLQAAVLAPQTGDSAATATFLQQPNSGASSRLPFFQSRISYENGQWFGTKKAGTLGISGHYGRSRVFTGATNIKNDIESIGIAVDWNFPLADRVSFSGEAFAGRNLGGFQAGIFQSYNTDFTIRQGTSLQGVRAIGTRGGWMQIGVTPNVAHDRLGIYASIGLDDPKDDDLFSISVRDWRTRNLAMAFNAIFKFTPQFSISGEFRRFHTNYFYTSQKRANHLNFGASYSF